MMKSMEFGQHLTSRQESIICLKEWICKDDIFFDRECVLKLEIANAQVDCSASVSLTCILLKFV